MNERLLAEKALMSQTLAELKAILSKAEMKMDVLMNLETSQLRGTLSLQKHIDDACLVTDILILRAAGK